MCVCVFGGVCILPLFIHPDLSTQQKKIKAAKHLVGYTGAGISTAAKIPDFRGPQGVWTRRDRGQTAPDCIAMEQAVPTLAHRAMTRLLELKIMKYLTSQNVCIVDVYVVVGCWLLFVICVFFWGWGWLVGLLGWGWWGGGGCV